MPLVLFVHQSAHLYGSDRVVHTLVTRLQANGYRPVVLLPVHGSLYDLLVSCGIETDVVALTTLSRAKLSLRGLLALPFSLMVSLSRVRRLIGGRPIRLIYSNTLAVLSGAVYASLARVTHILHVKDMVVAPTFARKGFPILLSLVADHVICNARLTRQWLVQGCRRLSNDVSTIWNGIERTLPCDRVAAVEFRRLVDRLSASFAVSPPVGRGDAEKQAAKDRRFPCLKLLRK